MVKGGAAALTARTVREIAPAVSEEMARWQQAAHAIVDPFLRAQALASQTHKRFHALGGSVYALLAPGRERQLVTLIVALQTISDYLDNLCDRGPCDDLEAYRQLHQAMLDAVEPGTPPAPYYELYPHQEDGGYLASLVAACQQAVAELPAFEAVRRPVRRFIGLYNDLQVYKHGPVEGRVRRLQRWFDAHRSRVPGLYWWEFAAASGSTLGVFALLAAAARPDLAPEAAARLDAAYFPWIGALHILLDYLIDMEEDDAAGDLNLVAPYPDGTERRRRLIEFVRRGLAEASSLPDAPFHRWVVHGLPALYLSDPKVKQQCLGGLARDILRAAGRTSRLLYALCRAQRHPLGQRFLPAL